MARALTFPRVLSFAGVVMGELNPVQIIVSPPGYVQRNSALSPYCHCSGSVKPHLKRVAVFAKATRFCR